MPPRRIRTPLSRFRLIGRGVYTVGEAARLTRVPRPTLRRWTQGYEYEYRGRARSLPPIIGTGVSRIDGDPVLEFLDLVEIQFLDAFRRLGVQTRTIRLASLRARDLLGRRHPFASQRFVSDGHAILMEIAPQTQDQRFLDLVVDQLEFSAIVTPFLLASLTFGETGQAEEWWPLGQGRHVVVSPRRAFGAPIVAGRGVPTRVLAKGVAVEGSAEAVAWWYDVEVDAVRDAVEFESSLV